jgi:RimJ/RimL family protein N-acetyltransferase
MTQLLPMIENEFQEYIDQAVEQFAEERIKAGTNTAEKALEQARKAIFSVIPDGLATKGCYFYTVYDEVAEQKVGILLFKIVQFNGGEPQAFVYDVLIYEPFRRRGYAQQAFTLLEEKVRALHIQKISLNVFGHNQAAIALYTKLGYITTDLAMAKRLS